MCCGLVESGRRSPKKGWAQRHFVGGFVAGVLLVLLTSLVVVSQQSAISAHYVFFTGAQWITDKQQIKAPAETENGKVVCRSDGSFSESCEVDGDVRVNGTALSVDVVVPASRSERREWRIRPYARRSVHDIKKVTVTQLPDPAAAAAPPCTLTYGVPAVLFAIGGHSGRNYFHDYTDVLVPLFAASRRYGGEVQFLVSNVVVQPRWLSKYEALLRRLSRYDVLRVDGDDDAHVLRCFPHVTVGLHIDKLFSIVPESVPGNDRRLSMADFTRFLRETYALPRDAAVSASLVRGDEPGRRKKPRLLLIHRGHYRRLVNEREVARAAEAAGFEAVVTSELRGGGGGGDSSVEEQARAVNSFDAMVGVHGAGLTNAVFLPPGAVLIQVVPYGKMEFIATSEFGEPAADMGLKYLGYSVSAEESTLLEELGPDHPAIRDPLSVHRSGWDKVDELYLRKQDVRVNVSRFAPTLAQALDHLRHR